MGGTQTLQLFQNCLVVGGGVFNKWKWVVPLSTICNRGHFNFSKCNVILAADGQNFNFKTNDTIGKREYNWAILDIVY